MHAGGISMSEDGPRLPAEVADRLAIRAVVEDWAIHRDAADWERFRGFERL